MVGQPGGSAERPALFFADAAEFRAWLVVNHDSATDLWMGLYKKHVVPRGLTWEEAVPEALCFGWIDSVAQRIDDAATRQRWTPRTPTSNWSAVNVALVAELTAAGKMHPAGVAAFERRRADRTGIYAYEQPAAAFTAEQEHALQRNPAAAAFWAAATATYRRVVTHWVVSAKQQRTRETRFAQLLDDCAHGRMVPPQRYGDAPRWLDRAAAAARAAIASTTSGSTSSGSTTN